MEITISDCVSPYSRYVTHTFARLVSKRVYGEPAFRGIETVLDLEGEETNRDEKTAGLTTKRRKRRRRERERERATSVSRCFNAGHFFPFNSFSILFRPNRSCSVPRATISISPRVSFVDQASRAKRERERIRFCVSARSKDRQSDRY